MLIDRKTFKFIASMLIVLLVMGCKENTSGPEVEEGPAPPVFNISSLAVTLQSGDPGIQFRAFSSVRVRLVEIKVTTPNNQSVVYSPQGLIVQANQAFDLQQPGTAFRKWSGTWRFQFVGNHEPTGEAFDVTQSMNVSAKYLAN